MHTLDELFDFIEGWVEPWHESYGLSSDVLDTLPMPEPLRRLLGFAGAWTHPELGTRLFDTRSFRLRLPPYRDIDADMLEGLTYYLGPRADAVHFDFATDDLDGWQAIATSASSNVVVLFEGEAYELPLESWLVRLCMRSLAHGRPSSEMHSHQEWAAERIEHSVLLIEDASPFPTPVNPDFANPEPIWIVDGRVLATPKNEFGVSGFVLAARNFAVLEDLC